MVERHENEINDGDGDEKINATNAEGNGIDNNGNIIRSNPTKRLKSARSMSESSKNVVMKPTKKSSLQHKEQVCAHATDVFDDGKPKIILA